MRKNGVVLGFVLALLLGACSQLPGFTPTPGTGPTVDLFQTAVAQTLTAVPPLITAPITDTATVPAASPTPVLPVSDTPSVTFTSTAPVTDLTTTPVTATSGPSTTTVPAGQVTPIWTLAVRKYGTLPPDVPFTEVTLINKANAEAYISLQVTMNDGKYSILEYPVEGRFKIQAPIGSYLYVAWVGGNKMVGNFRLHHNDDLSITLYKDKVVIR